MKKFISLFLLGAFSALSMAPYNFWPSLFVGLSALYICVTKCKNVRYAAFSGFSFSFGYFCFGLYWIGNALLVEGNPYWWVWPLAVTGLPFILSLFTAIACGLYKYICKTRSNIGTYLVFTAVLFLAEYARGHLFTGFPWNLYGYTWIDVIEIAQVAYVGNIYFLTFLTILWATFPAYILTCNNKKPLAALYATGILLTFLLSFYYGYQRLNESSVEDSEITIVLVQPNIKQSEKWKIENRSNNFLSIIELSKNTLNNGAEYNSIKDGMQLIIWPETAISQDLMSAPWVQKQIKMMLSSYSQNAFLITGALRYTSEDEAFHNSVVMYNSDAEIIHIYDKSHLVPFGEYIPFSNILDIAPIVGFKGFKKGETAALSKPINNLSIALQICYEIIFPKNLSNETQLPNLIINVTNDAWYGDSAGPYQHLVQARFRAIESNVTLVRSANTGVSAIVDKNGRIRKEIPLNTKVSITEKLEKSF